MKRGLCACAIVAACSYSVIPTYARKIRQASRRLCNQPSDAIYLTFDDGPSPEYTPKILDLLDELNIKASFFVVASFAEQNPELLARMQCAGHVIGLHSYEHKNGLFLPPWYEAKDFAASVAILHRLGVPVRYFRPPWGHCNLSMLHQIKHHHMTPIWWDVMAQDWQSNTSAHCIARKILRRTRPGDILCLHDGRGSNHAPERTWAALKQALPLLLEKGMRFDTVNHYETRQKNCD